MSRRRTAERSLVLGAAAAIAFACSFDRGDRWLAREPAGAVADACTIGELRCGLVLNRCEEGPDGPEWVPIDDCPARGLLCVPALNACAKCIPGNKRCDGTDLTVCKADGSDFELDHSCLFAPGVSCRDDQCLDLCLAASERWSNVGCEYWAVDLDNANVDDSLNAAAQQFAVVVSNPQPDLAATVTIDLDDTAAGEPNAPREVARATVPPFSLRVFKLGPREVDGSPPGEFNTGTHTALTRSAFRVRSDVPVVAFQFNPLENTNVFSNDASLLKPIEALRMGDTFGPAYVVLGWPQTIASTDDPETNFGTNPPLDLRAFLTIVGTAPKTRVRVTTRARIVGGGPIPETQKDGSVEFELGAFDVANLETDDFNGDFSGSLVESDKAVVVFSGGEASDAPWFETLSDRQCCADHLEEQLDPIRTAGKRFVATVTPNRSVALSEAGATGVGLTKAREFFRVVAATPQGAIVRTTLEPPRDRVVLSGIGDFAQIDSEVDFFVDSSEPISLASVSPSQGASGIPNGLPGGDPSLLVVPPLEQFRTHYVFLTPDRYSFDFIRIVAPAGTDIDLDGDSVDALPSCERSEFDSIPPAGSDDPPTRFAVYRCQLSFPTIDSSATATQLLSPGVQNDGVHEVVASNPVGVLVDGFDRNVSYAYAGGTELLDTVPH